MKYVIRIIVLPFIMGIALVTAIKMFILFNKDFLLYGGEMVSYRKDHTPTTIAEMLNFLKEKMNSEQGVHGSVATDAASSTQADPQNP
jgi:hypothetical protein